MARFFTGQPNAFEQFIQGTRAAEMENQAATVNALRQQQLKKAVETENALKEYVASGNIDALKRTNPRVGLQYEELERKRQQDQINAVPKALDFVYNAIPLIKQSPADKWPEIIKQASKIAPITESYWPKEYDQVAIDNFISNYEKMKKLSLNPYQQEMVAQGREKIALQKQKMNQPKEFAPVWFEDAEGNGEWVKPGSNPRNPQAKPSGKYKDTDYSRFERNLRKNDPNLSDEDIRKKWSLRTETDIPKWAIDKATAELNKNMDYQEGINPNTQKQFGPGEKEQYIMDRAKNFMQMRNKLGGKPSQNKPKKSLQNMTTQEIKDLIQQMQPQSTE